MNVESIVSLSDGAGRFLTVEEHVISNGFGMGFSAGLVSSGVKGAQVHALALPMQFIPHGSRPLLLSEYGLDARGIAEACRTLASGDVSGGAMTIEVTSNLL